MFNFGLIGFAGACSAINAAIVVPSVVAAEIAVADMTTEFNILLENAEKTLSSIEDTKTRIDISIASLKEEKKLIITWKAAAQEVKAYLGSFSEDILLGMKVFQDAFLEQIQTLQTAAEGFRDSVAIV